MARAGIPLASPTGLFTPSVLQFLRQDGRAYPRQAQRQIMSLVRPLAAAPLRERVITMEDGLPVIIVGQQVVITSTADGVNVVTKNHYARQCADGQRVPVSMDMVASLDELAGQPEPAAN